MTVWESVHTVRYVWKIQLFFSPFPFLTPRCFPARRVSTYSIAFRSPLRRHLNVHFLGIFSSSLGTFDVLSFTGKNNGDVGKKGGSAGKVSARKVVTGLKGGGRGRRRTHVHKKSER